MWLTVAVVLLGVTIVGTIGLLAWWVWDCFFSVTPPELRRRAR